MRVGTGYDVHRLSEGRKLILGGVEIPFEKGLLGHSDADVIVHAIMDSLLGAAALGDIGQHFPAAAEADAVSSADAGECCQGTETGDGSGQHQGNDGRKAWIYGIRRGYRGAGSLLSDSSDGSGDR